jgi:putative PIN family toxin of toxin-antitoxin system
MARLKVVLDTNIWMSAALSADGAPAAVARHVLADGLPVFSPATFDELQTRLWKPKFDRYLTLELRRRLLHDLQACALWVEPGPDLVARRFSRDPDDDAFIHAALAAEAGALVTGDQDLLSIGKPLPFPILTAAQALADPRFAVR